PIRGKPFGVLRMESVAERVADYLVGHHPGMPGLGQAVQASTGARRFVHGLHAFTMPGPRRAWSRSCARPEVHGAASVRMLVGCVRPAPAQAGWAAWSADRRAGLTRTSTLVAHCSTDPTGGSLVTSGLVIPASSASGTASSTGRYGRSQNRVTATAGA